MPAVSDSIETAFERLKESVRSEEPRDFRNVKFEPGKAVRQGDIYPVLRESVPKDAEEIKTNKLAEGTQPGARHYAKGAVKLFRSKNPGPLEGPYVKAVEPWTVAHPDHADNLMPAGTFQIMYQRDYDEKEMRRVFD